MLRNVRRHTPPVKRSSSCYLPVAVSTLAVAANMWYLGNVGFQSMDRNDGAKLAVAVSLLSPSIRNSCGSAGRGNHGRRCQSLVPLSADNTSTFLAHTRSCWFDSGRPLSCVAISTNSVYSTHRKPADKPSFGQFAEQSVDLAQVAAARAFADLS